MPKGQKAAADKAAISKYAAVGDALAKLGKKAQPVDIQRFVKETHGITMPTSLISNYKHHLVKGKRKGKRGRKAGGRAAAPVAASTVGAGLTISVGDIDAVKKLCDRLGADKVRQLAQVLAK
jgi:hypothetical protein